MPSQKPIKPHSLVLGIIAMIVVCSFFAMAFTSGTRVEPAGANQIIKIYRTQAQVETEVNKWAAKGWTVVDIEFTEGDYYEPFMVVYRRDR